MTERHGALLAAPSRGPDDPAVAPDRVLVVDDEDDVRALVVLHLRAQGHEVLEASNGPDGLRLARAAKPDLVLLDITMPGLDGYAVCREIAAWGAAAPPVIILTAQADVSARVVGLDAGATDYVVKPFAGAELVARVRAALRTKAVTDALSTAAATDPLTGLLNRRQLDARAVEAIALAGRGHPLACLLVDVDGFKQVNDTLGHEAGDDLLRHVAGTLRTAARVSDVVARYGGDEFVLLLTERADGAKRTAERILAALAERGPEHRVSGDGGERGVQVAVSVGLALWQAGMETPADLYSAADEMLYQAKRRGGRRVVSCGEAVGGFGGAAALV